MDTLTVQNDPKVDQDGIASFFIINYCAYAAQNLGYTTVPTDCETDQAKTDVLSEQWLVNTKTITRYFDPNTYDSATSSLSFRQAQEKTGFFT